MDITFSIIVPVYNSSQWLRECLNSILAQTCLSWECICVDDGSTDDSREILQDYARKDSRIKIHCQVNSGVSAARNVGMSMAKGRYIWFVDSDDQISTIALALAESAFTRFPTASAFFFGYSTSHDDLAVDEGTIPGDISFAPGFSGKAARLFLNPAYRFIIRHEICDNVLFKGYKYNEDALFMMTVCWRAKGLAITPTTLYFYRLHESSATHKSIDEAEVARIFESEREIYNQAAFNRDLWKRNDLTEFWSFFHSRVYGTYYSSYFKLPLAGRMRLFPQWRELQKVCMKEYRVPVGRKIRCRLALLLNSGLFVKFCVYAFADGLMPVRKMLARLTRR